MTHAVLIGMHKTVDCSGTVACLCYVYNCRGAALRGTLFLRIYKIYFVFISHVNSEMISDTCLKNFLLCILENLFWRFGL